MAPNERSLKKMKILITETASLISNNDLNLDVFKKYGDVVFYENISRNNLLNEVVDTDVILCNKADIDREVIYKAKNLKYIGTFATGYNNIDISAAKERSVTVCNAAGYSTNAVVQQVMAYILSHYTKIYQYNNFVQKGGWKNAKVFSPLEFSTDEVFSKTLGIIGYGTIGKALASVANAMGMNILVHTRTPKNDDIAKFVSLDYLLENSDVVTLHCPLNEQSKDLMNRDTFRKMKKGSYFINTSRGGTVDENALFEALSTGHLSGAAIDVLKQEPMAENCVLYNAPNLLITPHSAWAPLSTRKRLVELVAKNLEDFLQGEEVNNLAK